MQTLFPSHWHQNSPVQGRFDVHPWAESAGSCSTFGKSCLCSLISLLPVHMGLQLFPSSSPLSLFRALFLSYLAFSSLSPDNLFDLLSPTISPFLVIVSIPFFCFILFYFSLDGGLGALLCAGVSSNSHNSPSHQIRVLSTAEGTLPTPMSIFYLMDFISVQSYESGLGCK